MCVCACVCARVCVFVCVCLCRVYCKVAAKRLMFCLFFVYLSSLLAIDLGPFFYWVIFFGELLPYAAMHVHVCACVCTKRLGGNRCFC